MSYSDDLDWLARNVHEWPGSKALKIFKSDSNSVTWIQYPESLGVEYFTYEQWLARRAELQNKPSWADAPDWAQWLAQDEDGEWKWLGENPSPGCDYWAADELRSQCKGAVIGDWRDTLEKRPDMYKNHEKIDKSVGHAQKEAKPMHDWYERGELPPVGAFVDVTGVVVYGEGEKGCEVIAHVENCAVIRMSWGLGCFEAKALSPTRTERDVLIEIVVSRGLINPSEIADAILVAGFKREGGSA